MSLLEILDSTAEGKLTSEELKLAQHQFSELIVNKYSKLLDNNPYLAFEYGSLLDLTEAEQETLTPAMAKVWAYQIEELYENQYRIG